MFALATLLTTPLRVAPDIGSFNGVEAPTPSFRGPRLVGRWTCAPGARRPTCAWAVEATGGERFRSPDWRRAA